MKLIINNNIVLSEFTYIDFEISRTNDNNRPKQCMILTYEKTKLDNLIKLLNLNIESVIIEKEDELGSIEKIDVSEYKYLVNIEKSIYDKQNACTRLRFSKFDSY